MATFGKSSKEKLATLHPDLQKVLNLAIKKFDFTILCGYRNQVDQDAAFADKKSKLKWPNSKHNSLPSRAVDVALCPVNWNDRDGFIRLLSFIQGVGYGIGVNLRAGCDWDSDGLISDENFQDLPHIEILD